MILLAINIPTYERLESFSSIMGELEMNLKPLAQTLKDMIEINVFENNSSVANQKQKLCKEISSRSSIQIFFSINQKNIGGDRNILRCCSGNSNARFTWVLGDDDHIVSDSILKILFLLFKHKDNLGLLILSDNSYNFNPILKNKLITSYEQFARSAINIQPHLLIAHTLISCNIFRTDIFDYSEASYVIESLTPRSGLIANFAHMRGMIKGLLSSNNQYNVLIPSFTTLDTTKRLPPADNFTESINKIYYFYFLWLLVELGVNIENVPRHQEMWWLFGSAKLPSASL